MWIACRQNTCIEHNTFSPHVTDISVLQCDRFVRAETRIEEKNIGLFFLAAHVKVPIQILLKTLSEFFNFCRRCLQDALYVFMLLLVSWHCVFRHDNLRCCCCCCSVCTRIVGDPVLSTTRKYRHCHYLIKFKHCVFPTFFF